jgi:hypothetical protein
MSYADLTMIDPPWCRVLENDVEGFGRTIQDLDPGDWFQFVDSLPLHAVAGRIYVYMNRAWMPYVDPLIIPLEEQFFFMDHSNDPLDVCFRNCEYWRHVRRYKIITCDGTGGGG